MTFIIVYVIGLLIGLACTGVWLYWVREDNYCITIGEMVLAACAVGLFLIPVIGTILAAVALLFVILTAYDSGEFEFLNRTFFHKK